MTKNTRLGMSILFSIIILLSALLTYLYTRKINENDLNNNSKMVISNFYKDIYDGNLKSLSVNGEVVKLELRDGILFINDEEKGSFSLKNIYVTGPLLILAQPKKFGEEYRIFNSNGEELLKEYQEVEENLQFTNLRVENNYLLADSYSDSCDDIDSCNEVVIVSFVYDNNEVKLQAVSNEKKTESEEEQVTKKIFKSIQEIEYDLEKKNKEININNKRVTINEGKDTLFVNNTKYSYFGIEKIYLVDNLIFLEHKGQLGETYRIFNEDGNEVIIDWNSLPETVQFFNLRIDQDALYADSKDVDCYSDSISCDKVRKVEFIYENNKISLRGIYTTNKEKFSIFEKNNFDGAGNAYIVNGKHVELKIGDGILYINDKKYDYFTPQYVYVLDDIIMISYQAQGQEIYHFFDENGREIPIDRNGIDENITLKDFQLINGALYAKASDNKNVEFVYENGIITLFREY